VKVRKLKNALQLSQSMATITNGQSSERAQQRAEKQLEYRTLAPVALEKLKEKNGELGMRSSPLCIFTSSFWETTRRRNL
jgi:two-component sensor histidine kinase